MIHHATLGSVERFLSVFIEHTGGWFPFWCAPEQVRILTVNDQVERYVSEIEQILSTVTLTKPLKGNDLRFKIDDSNESLGKKIRRATEMKVPVVLIVGPKDEEAKLVSLRLKDTEEKVKLSDLANYLQSIEK